LFGNASPPFQLTPEVFGWVPASNNQLLIAGRASYILNSISAYRSAQQDVPKIAKDIYFTPALKGPGGIGWASEHVIYVSVIPKFAARNADLAKQFLLHLVANYDQAMWNSKLYNTPSFFHAPVPGGNRGYPSVKGAKTMRDNFRAWLSKDPFALPGEATNKLVPL
jgi:multiple sugar transport system substrate-binding protein